ncbi:anhydro-N-acetylmuramic acid kinase [Sulfobacillus thermosulfidooxidans]|uniref:anhydro-N-acetylmuramic acid kinase n=1 Tax=Sulfobacillus thermosulfidooxidans TaxID=28034 RepID=UPI00031A0D34|nr:anhydro-N-acetylmuramic acid kinase [Sulfobacillus thermosulfidooxidans]
MATSWAIGLMTGTSADGIDAALVSIEENGTLWPTCQLVGFDYHPFTEVQRQDIFSLFQSTVSLKQLGQVHTWLARECAQSVQRLLEAYGLEAQDIRAVGFHGQTIAHYPEMGFTLQIGDPALLAALTDIPVISNFRSSDVAAGGQGAPLVPYFDYAMFRSPARSRVLLNIGGIANITVIPPNAEIQDVMGFDTGPGNMLLDGIMVLVSQGTYQFDDKGHYAALGQADLTLVKQWMNHPYLKQKAPKSAGREQFGRDYCSQLMGDMKAHDLSQEDSLRTVCAFIAESIAQAIKEQVSWPYDLIVSGGGVHNETLMAELSKRLGGVKWQHTDAFKIPGDAKEAMAFAYFAWQFLEGRPTNIPQVTGAKMPALLGSLTLRPGHFV